MAVILNLTKKLFTSQYIQSRGVTTLKNRLKMNRDRKIGPTIDSSADSLAAKGFLRNQKEYHPPNNVATIIDSIYGKISSSVPITSEKLDNDTKYKLLTACEQEINHSVPNSLLHTIESLEDIKKFYNTPVNTTLPMDTIRKMSLPKNLHIEYEYHRFDPTTDTRFNGKTAFPESSTLVTGLKSRKKYTGQIYRKKWLL